MVVNYRVLVDVSGGDWEKSLENTGGNWGGLEDDESDYGL